MHRSSNRRRLARKDRRAQSSTKCCIHNNSSGRRLIFSKRTISTSTLPKAYPFQLLITNQNLITTTIIPKPSSTEIQKLYYTNNEIQHMKKIYQRRDTKERVTKSMRELSSKIKERLARNVDDDLSVECIVNAGEDLNVSSSSSGEYYTKRSSSTKMGDVIERASCTLPSMITLLL